MLFDSIAQEKVSERIGPNKQAKEKADILQSSSITA